MSIEIAALRPLRGYQEELKHIFPSETSLRWFVRQHRAKLVAEGALVMLGNRWMATPKLHAVVIEIGTAAAAAASE